MSSSRPIAPIAAFALGALVAGCSMGASPGGESVAASPPDSSEYVALGTEPFWSVKVTHGGIVFSEPENPTGTRGEYAPGIVAGDSIRFLTVLEDADGTPLELVLRREPCSDGMSDRHYAFSAIARIGGRLRTGCADPEPLGAGRPGIGSAPELGDWEIVAHLSPGATALPDSVASGWHGNVIHYGLDRAASGADTCLEPDYRETRGRADSVLSSRFHVPPAALGVQPEAEITEVRIHCAETPWAAPGGTLLRLPDGRWFTVWDGTFFELRRWNPGPPEGSNP